MFGVLGICSSITARLCLLSRSTTYVHIGVLRCSTYGLPALMHCSTSYVHIVVTPCGVVHKTHVKIRLTAMDLGTPLRGVVEMQKY